MPTLSGATDGCGFSFVGQLVTQTEKPFCYVFSLAPGTVA
jgi:hypothetical protein